MADSKNLRIDTFPKTGYFAFNREINVSRFFSNVDIFRDSFDQQLFLRVENDAVFSYIIYIKI